MKRINCTLLTLSLLWSINSWASIIIELDVTPPMQTMGGEFVPYNVIQGYEISYAIGEYVNPIVFRTESNSFSQFIVINDYEPLPVKVLFAIAAVAESGVVGVYSEVMEVYIDKPTAPIPININVICKEECNVTHNM